MIKHKFDKLKSFGKKRYFSKNGDEELYFTNKKLTIEISNTNSFLDVAIESENIRENYKSSPILTNIQKGQINSALCSPLSLDEKCMRLSEILINIFSC